MHKPKLHLRNKHRERYDFKILIESCPALAPFVQLNAYNDLSIDFFNPEAVKLLNKALLMHYYDINYWDIPPHYLCPPIPGRADYIHYIADLVGDSQAIQCLDIGVGANCVYPIIGVKEYGWNFIGSDIDPVAIESARKIVDLNPSLKGKIEIRLQTNPSHIFQGIIQKNDKIDVTICNPPFHSSHAEARAGTMRKLNNLTGKKNNELALNFGGQNNELWCKGGESQFVGKMIQESSLFSHACTWFTSLIAKEKNLPSIDRALKNAKVLDVKIIPMGQGNKISRIVAWTFQSGG